MLILRHYQLRAAAEIIKNGGVIVYPTDTVWGLGCAALDPAAVTKLRALKHKPADAPLIWLLPSVAAVSKFCGAITPREKQLLRSKHTTVLIHGQAVRVIRSGWLNKLLTACGGPLVSTSANRHGQPVVSSWRQAVTALSDADAVIRGRKIYAALPSSLVAVAADGTVQVLRAGAGYH